MHDVCWTIVILIPGELKYWYKFEGPNILMSRFFMYQQSDTTFILKLEGAVTYHILASPVVVYAPLISVLAITTQLDVVPEDSGQTMGLCHILQEIHTHYFKFNTLHAG